MATISNYEYFHRSSLNLYKAKEIVMIPSRSTVCEIKWSARVNLARRDRTDIHHGVEEDWTRGGSASERDVRERCTCRRRTNGRTATQWATKWEKLLSAAESLPRFSISLVTNLFFTLWEQAAGGRQRGTVFGVSSEGYIWKAQYIFSLRRDTRMCVRKEIVDEKWCTLIPWDNVESNRTNRAATYRSISDIRVIFTARFAHGSRDKSVYTWRNARSIALIRTYARRSNVRNQSF